jgi:hypothetical protein
MKHVLRIAAMLLVSECALAGTSGVTVDASPWSIVAMFFIIGANLLAVAVLVDGLVHLSRWLMRRLGSARPPE